MRILRFYVLYSAVIILICNSVFGASQPSSTPGKILITNVNILDITSGQYHRSDNLVVTGGLITAIDESQTRCEKPACLIIDGQGGYLIPGLSDMHSHLAPGDFSGRLSAAQRAEIARNHLKFGITMVFNPNIKFDDHAYLTQLRQKQASEYPHYRGATVNIGMKDGWGDTKVSNEAEIETAVAEAVAAGAYMVKITIDDMSWLGSDSYPMLSRSMVRAAVAKAHQLDTKIVAHVAQLEHARMALEEGVDGLIHGIIDKPVDESWIQLMQRSGAFYMATLSLYEMCADISTAVQRQKSFDSTLANGTDIYQTMSSSETESLWRTYWDKTDSVKALLPIQQQNIRAIAAAGIPVLTGSDSGTPGVIAGAAALWELKLHQEAGIEPIDVLRFATINAAKILGISDQTGTITVGKAADLVLLAEDPLKDLDALQSLQWTMREGHLVTLRN